jgi:hypothetical protein
LGLPGQVIAIIRGIDQKGKRKNTISGGIPKVFCEKNRLMVKTRLTNKK